MKGNQPVLIKIIIDLNLICCVLLVISLFPNITKKFGVYFMSSTFSDIVIRVLMIIILLTITYGFSKLLRWGYWLMVIYNLFFLLVAIIFLIKQNQQSFYAQQLISSVLGLSITLPTKQYFYKEN